ELPMCLGEGKTAQKIAWPKQDDQLDFSRPDRLPEQGCWQLYSRAPLTTPAIVRYPQRGRQLEISVLAEEGPDMYWGIWLNQGGHDKQKNFSIQPAAGR